VEPAAPDLVRCDRIAVVKVDNCPGRKPPFLAVMRPLRPLKNAVQTGLLRRKLRALKRPGRARTVVERLRVEVLEGERDHAAGVGARERPLPGPETAILGR
jgi:hypothetical protein